MRKPKSRITVIDLSNYNVQSIASVLFGYAMYTTVIRLIYNTMSVTAFVNLP